MLKNNKGITLVALVITIIVLLILAVVAIGAVRDSGIIGHAQNSADKYNTGKAEEESKLKGFEDEIKKYETEGFFGTSGDGTGDVVGEKVTYKDGVPVPSGFYYVTGTKDTGFVISDDKSDENNANGKSGNQFVWVPVTEDISTTEYISETDYYKEPCVIISNSDYSGVYDAVLTNLQIAECEDIDEDKILETEDFESELTSNYKAMAESVNKYDGFYVGRFETSINGLSPESKHGVAAATAIEESANTWYGLYALNKKYKTSSVQSSMIWGILYDKMISWMGEKANIDIGDKRNKNIICGTAPDDVIKNVYDLYGNREEWTLEAAHDEGEYRVYRGREAYNSKYVPNYRNYASPTIDRESLGSRMILYVI